MLSCQPKVFYLACYLAELTFIDIKLNKWLPSRIAISALYLAKKMNNDMHDWNRSPMPVVGKVTEDEVRQSAREMCSLIDCAHTKKIYDPIYKKYLRGKFLCVAKIPVMIRQ